MAAIVPDTLQGALIVSVIDFFLSFLIISGIGVVLSFFPLLNRVAKFINAPKPVVAPMSKAAPVARKPAAGAAASDDIAAIAAAVFVAMDGAPHRIINVEPSRSRSAWVVGGRIAQHGSHIPSR
jgi:Na+-transporting methylmalonyl-CoA/oxaloacetate decarboxylase gamma subunit